jgi:xylan 1,4-beta-xylosidase
VELRSPLLVCLWAFQFEDREYFAGLRTLSTNGIDKPVLNVFRLLANLGGTRLHLASDGARDPLAQDGGDAPNVPPDVSGIAALDELGRIQVFLCSHHDDWDVATKTQVEVCLSGLEPGKRYAVYRSTVDGVSGNAHTAWVRMGRPQPPDEAQRRQLQAASELKAERLLEVESDGGWCVFSVMLSAHSVCLLKIVPVS